MNDEHAFLYRRAEQELEMAQRAGTNAAVHAHNALANLYLQRIAAAASNGLDSGGHIGHRGARRTIGPET